MTYKLFQYTLILGLDWLLICCKPKTSPWLLLILSLSNFYSILSITCASSETQGQIKGTRESLNGWKNIYGTKKSKERQEEPLGTMSYQASSKRSPPFWLLIGARKLPQGLFSPFFTFLRSIYIFPPL